MCEGKDEESWGRRRTERDDVRVLEGVARLAAVGLEGEHVVALVGREVALAGVSDDDGGGDEAEPERRRLLGGERLPRLRGGELVNG